MPKYIYFKLLFLIFLYACNNSSNEIDLTTNQLQRYDQLMDMPLDSLYHLNKQDTSISANKSLLEYVIGRRNYSLGNYIKAFRILSNTEKNIINYPSLSELLPQFYHITGLTHSSLNNYEEAIIYQEKYSYLAKKGNAQEDYINSLVALTAIYNNLDKKEEALAYNQEALNFLDTTTLQITPDIAFWWYYNIGYTYLYHRQGNKSLKYFLKAKSLDEPDKMTYKSVYALTGVADFYHYQNKDSAIIYFEKVRNISDSFTLEQKIYANLGLGRSYHTQNIDLATNKYEEALRLSNIHNIKKHIPEICDSLYNIHINQTPIKALKYRSIAYDYIKEQDREKTKTEFIINMAQTEKEKQHEIDFLNIQQAIKKSNIKRLRINIFIVIIISILLLGFSILLYRLNREKKDKNQILINQNIEITQRNEEIQRQSVKLQTANEQIIKQNKTLEQELVKKMLRIATKNEMLNTLTKSIDSISFDQDEKRKLKTIVKNYTTEEIWNEVDLQFAKTNEVFFAKLSAISLDLTDNDYRLSAFVKQNLSTKEIARLMFKSTSSVKMAKSRLRKKLGLTDSKVKLVSFLNSI